MEGKQPTTTIVGVIKEEGNNEPAEDEEQSAELTSTSSEKEMSHRFVMQGYCVLFSYILSGYHDIYCYFNNSPAVGYEVRKR